MNMHALTKSFTRFFERSHPHTVAYYIGRKNAEKIFDCKIKKKSKLLADSNH